MIDRRIAARLGAVAFLFATAAAFSVGRADARVIAGMEISDCVPGATNCRQGGSTAEPSGMNRFVRARMCRAKASRAPFPEDRPMIFAVCMRG